MNFYRKWRIIGQWFAFQCPGTYLIRLGWNLVCLTTSNCIRVKQPSQILISHYIVQFNYDSTKFNIYFRQSLLVMYGPARYDWEHQILREDITDRRVCLAYREFTPPYLPSGSEYYKSEHILNRSLHFFVT